MPRHLRFNLAGVPQHLVQRGNNRGACFFSASGRLAYLEWLGEAARMHGVAIHAYVLMDNHVHLLATPARAGALSAMMQALGRRYVRYVNRATGRSGTLWEGRFKACVVDSDRYALTAYRYIELNPVRAGLVAHPGAYRWSSYPGNAGERHDRLLVPHECYLALGANDAERAGRYRSLCADAPDPRHLAELRGVARRQLVFGDEAFKDAIATLTGRPTRPLRQMRDRGQINKG